MAGEMNLNYPSSSGYLRNPDGINALGSIQTSGTTSGASTGNPGLAAAGLGLDVIGTGMNIYNQLSASDQAEKQYEQALREYEEQKKRQREIDQINKQQMMLGNAFTGGEYANKLLEQSGTTQNYYQNAGV